MSELVIGPASVEILDELYEVAIKTGYSGNDASGMYINDEIIGEIFVGPYVTLSQSSAFALFEDGKAVGYGLCVLDTATFQDACQKSWWPLIQKKYEHLRSIPASDPSHWLLGEVFSPTPSPSEILSEYPSHGHIDLLPHVQGKGWGRRMMARMEIALQSQGSKGFHLRVSPSNTRALTFYNALGYSEVFRNHSEVVVGKSLAK